MTKQSIITVTNGSLAGLLCIHRYRFLTGSQYARVSGFSIYHARECLRRFAERGLLGYFGFTGIPGQGKTPKVYFLTKKGYAFLQRESDCPEELVDFQSVNQDVSWSPKMYHRLALIDLFTALEASLKDQSAIVLLHT